MKEHKGTFGQLHCQSWGRGVRCTSRLGYTDKAKLQLPLLQSDQCKHPSVVTFFYLNALTDKSARELVLLKKKITDVLTGSLDESKRKKA